MSLFKTNPEIFCNGKFRFRSVSGNTFDLVGVSNKQYYPEDRCLLCYNFSGQIIEKDVEACTLIARPIESMTDEETREVFGEEVPDSKIDSVRWFLIEECNSEYISLSRVCRLTERGIYPGPQSDFDNGNVIAREG